MEDYKGEWEGEGSRRQGFYSSAQHWKQGQRNWEQGIGKLKTGPRYRQVP